MAAFIVCSCWDQRRTVVALEAWIQASEPNFLLSVGDQFYDGPLDDEDPRWDHTFRWIYNYPALNEIKWIVIHGVCNI
jgi:hypothetical protein